MSAPTARPSEARASPGALDRRAAPSPSARDGLPNDWPRWAVPSPGARGVRRSRPDAGGAVSAELGSAFPLSEVGSPLPLSPTPGADAVRGVRLGSVTSCPWGASAGRGPSRTSGASTGASTVASTGASTASPASASGGGHSYPGVEAAAASPTSPLPGWAGSSCAVSRETPSCESAQPRRRCSAVGSGVAVGQPRLLTGSVPPDGCRPLLLRNRLRQRDGLFSIM